MTQQRPGSVFASCGAAAAASHKFVCSCSMVDSALHGFPHALISRTPSIQLKQLSLARPAAGTRLFDNLIPPSVFNMRRLLRRTFRDNNNVKSALVWRLYILLTRRYNDLFIRPFSPPANCGLPHATPNTTTTGHNSTWFNPHSLCRLSDRRLPRLAPMRTLKSCAAPLPRLPSSLLCAQPLCGFPWHRAEKGVVRLLCCRRRTWWSRC